MFICSVLGLVNGCYKCLLCLLIINKLLELCIEGWKLLVFLWLFGECMNILVVGVRLILFNFMCGKSIVLMFI